MNERRLGLAEITDGEESGRRGLTPGQHLLITAQYVANAARGLWPTSWGRVLGAGALGVGGFAADEAARIFSQSGRPAMVAQAAPNLAEICRVGFRLRIAEYNDTNGKEFYQDGEDQIAAITGMAKLTFQVRSKDVKAIVNNKPVDEVVTDNNGSAEFNIFPTECNAGDKLLVTATIETKENRIYTKEIGAENGKRQPLNVFLRRGSTASAATPDRRTPVPTPTGTATQTATGTVAPPIATRIPETPTPTATSVPGSTGGGGSFPWVPVGAVGGVIAVVAAGIFAYRRFR